MLRGAGLTSGQAGANDTPTLAWRRTSTSFATLSPTFTTHQLIATEAEYEFVCLQYENDATATTMDIAAARVAPSAQVNNSYDPVDSTGTAVAWTTVTFNNLGVYGLPPSPSGATATLSGIASTTDTTVPTRAFSDWIPLSALTRSDGGTLPLLMIRTLSGAAGTYRAINQGSVDPAWQDSGTNLGRLLFSARRSGDYVTTNTTSLVAAPVLSDLVSPSAVLYIPRYRGATVMGIGDSLTASNSTAAYNMRGWGFLSTVSLSRTAFPVEWVCEASPGLTSAQYYQRGANNIPIVKPTIATLQVYSGNEANNTSTIVEAAWQRAILLADLTRRNGGVPLFVAPYPRDFTGGTETLRQGILARLRAMSAAGSALVLDADAVLADPGATNQIRTEYRQDATHANAAGEAALATAVAPLLWRGIRGLR